MAVAKASHRALNLMVPYLSGGVVEVDINNEMLAQ